MIGLLGVFPTRLAGQPVVKLKGADELVWLPEQLIVTITL